MKYSICSIIVLIIFLSCGGEDRSVSVPEPDVPTAELVIVDSIGVEMGDSTYMFGSIESLSYTSDGSIVLLDRAFSRIMVYSRDGEFQRQIGREGDGPGEMSLTVMMVLTGEGDLIVSQRDAMEHYDYPTGEWIEEYPRGATPPPFVLHGMPDSTFVGVHLEMLPEGGKLIAEVTLGIYIPGINEPSVILAEHSFELNSMNAAFLFEDVLDAYSVAVKGDGAIYVASTSGSEYRVLEFNPDGEEVFELVRNDIEPVEMTSEELQEEKEFMEARLESMGAGGQRCSPNPLLPMISYIGVGRDGNLWVRRGNVPLPVFDVYNDSGELLRAITLHVEPDEARYWNISVQPDGILAYSENPSQGYQKVYMLDIR
ncbi:MAG: 6-bladed beta-propeller [Candidatus Aegiribacteria sp.]|nr:6-bladed beta-propeller [Candidatus Aegiribacteria sp.]